MIFDHVGIACENIREEFEFYKLLGYVELLEFEDPLQKVKGIFIRCPGSNVLELLQPLSENSPLKNYIKSHIQMYHLAYRCDKIDNKIEELTKKGAILVSPPQESVAFEGKKIAFLLLRNGMLVELIGF